MNSLVIFGLQDFSLRKVFLPEYYKIIQEKYNCIIKKYKIPIDTLDFD